MVAARRREEIDRNKDAMLRLPETDDEVAEATRLAVNALDEEPWERWW